MAKRDIPVYSHPIIETHCHLDYLEGDELSAVVSAAQAVNVEQLITIAVSPGNLSTVRQIAGQFDNVFCTQGVHPHEAEDYNDDVDSEIRQHLADSKVVAVGEIGLDYFYDHADRKQQQIAFERQLQIACEADLPIVVHARDADDDTQAILRNFSTPLKRKGVIHSFTAGVELAEFCLSEGFHLGFNGIITFNKAENVRDIVRLTPIEQMLVETDSPYLTPVPYRGKPNQPKYVPFVCEKIAEIKGVTVESLLPELYQNSKQVFKLP
ncbi:TatD family hydrolase [Salinibius halmophilus]|uniref:TatD family hydrolase n=1 Tax=Salinibius halmophilus TaxID=1853216 RepID=UPI000E666830|nr:TatD family hydrolase [Salinibius halmophilus]